MGWLSWGRKEEKPASDSSLEKPKKKICCACPDTKRARDECVTLHGPESDNCIALIEAHKDCLRSEGFKV
eukprot:jgi/Botrbrau1/18149/Bobra.53_1s0020.1